MSPNLQPPAAGAMPPPGPPPEEQQELTSEEVIKRYGTQLKAMIDKRCREAIDREKIQQYAICRELDFYYRGVQYLVPTLNGSGDVVDYKPVASQMPLANGKQQEVVYDYVVNNFRGDMRKFVGVLGQKSPNVRAMPSWSSDDTGTRRANIATDCATYLHSQWDVDAAHRYVALSVGKNGTTFIYTPWVADADRYGEREEPVWGTKTEQITPDAFHCQMCGVDTPGSMEMPPPACIGCGAPLGPQNFTPGETQDVPAIVDTKTYPNGAVECSIHSPYDVTTPFYVKDLEHCPWLWLDFEDDSAYLASKFPGRGLEEDLDRAQDRDASSSTDLGRLAREQASSATGYTSYNRPNRWAYSRFWVRPSMYLYLIKGSGQQAVADLKKQFPRGMKLSFVNKKLVQVEHERLDEVWAAIKPETSEYLYADPIFKDYKQIADIANDGANIMIQEMETSIPVTIYDTNLLRPEKIQRGFSVNEFIPSAVPGAMLDKGFHRLPTAEVSAEVMNFVKEIIATGREIIGLNPAVWGGDSVANETAEAARRRLNQALMVLSTTWNEMRGGWARAYRNGIRQLARYSLGRLVSTQGDAESVTFREVKDIEELLQGGWEMECDQAIPMNWTQLRDFVQSMFTMAPEIAHAMGMDDPKNLEKINEGIGVPGWQLRGVDEMDAVHALIGQLMQGEPVIGPDGVNQPSIPLDFNVVWNPKSTIDVIHGWCMSEEGRSADGTPGFANVVAAGMAALHAMAPPPMPPEGGGGPHGAPVIPGSDAQTIPETIPGANAPVAPESPLPPLPQQTGLLNGPPQGSVQ